MTDNEICCTTIPVIPEIRRSSSGKTYYAKITFYPTQSGDDYNFEGKGNTADQALADLMNIIEAENKHRIFSNKIALGLK
jgi:hypothetical protein